MDAPCSRRCLTLLAMLRCGLLLIASIKMFASMGVCGIPMLTRFAQSSPRVTRGCSFGRSFAFLCLSTRSRGASALSRRFQAMSLVLNLQRHGWTDDEILPVPGV